MKWALEVPGVTRAWCFPKEMGQGHVTVRFMTDGMTENGIPNARMIKTVQEYIEAEMPVTTVLHVVAPIPKKLDMTVDILPDTERLRQQVEGAIAQTIIAESSPSGAILQPAHVA